MKLYQGSFHYSKDKIIRRLLIQLSLRTNPDQSRSKAVATP